MKALPPLELTFDGQPGAAGDLVILHHTPAWWIAEFRGAVAQRVKAITGASTVVTGFNGHVPGSVVCKAIALLNPNAEVVLAQAGEEPHAKKAAPEEPNALLAIAADVVANCRPSRAGEAPQARADAQRARRIRRSLGMMAACSYLRDRGWSFDSAHRMLLEAAQPATSSR
jgi:hypothetical protein